VVDLETGIGRVLCASISVAADTGDVPSQGMPFVSPPPGSLEVHFWRLPQVFWDGDGIRAV
jgi:hypothetical protein